MYDFIKAQYKKGIPWEKARDRVYERYQVKRLDGYKDFYARITKNSVSNQSGFLENCDQCAASGINFAAGFVSLFYV